MSVSNYNIIHKSWKFITGIAEEQIVLQLAEEEKETPSAKIESFTVLTLVDLILFSIKLVPFLLRNYIKRENYIKNKR
jgi:hypothetical protein